MVYRGRVLIVDDDPSVQLILYQMLAAKAFYCIAVGDGEQALTEARNQSLDVVLLDVRLPGISGLEVLQDLRAIQPAASVLMISGMDDLPTAVEAMKCGAHDYISKPFDLADLVERVNQALRQHHHLLETLGRERDMKETIRQQGEDIRELVGQTIQYLMSQHLAQQQLYKKGAGKRRKIDRSDIRLLAEALSRST